LRHTQARWNQERRMPTEIDDAALAYLLVRAGLNLTEAQKAELKSVYAGIAQMAERVRRPRGHMAELAHIFNFTEEDLA
jgi:hypothetical protein